MPQLIDRPVCPHRLVAVDRRVYEAKQQRKGRIVGLGPIGLQLRQMEILDEKLLLQVDVVLALDIRPHSQPERLRERISLVSGPPQAFVAPAPNRTSVFKSMATSVSYFLTLGERCAGAREKFTRALPNQKLT